MATTQRRRYANQPRRPVVYRTTRPKFAAQRQAMGPRERVSDSAGFRHGTQLAKGDPAHLVMAEFLVAIGVIGMRAVGQYEPRGQGTRRGNIVPSPGKLGPLPMLAATLIVFFILSLFAAAGGTRARVAAIIGGIYDLAMLLNSTTEMAKLTGHLASIGQGRQSPGGGPGPGGAAYGESPIRQAGGGAAKPSAPANILQDPQLELN